jgi:hypothetical protein
MADHAPRPEFVSRTVAQKKLVTDEAKEEPHQLTYQDSLLVNHVTDT